MSNPLNDIVPARHRRRVYALLALIALALAAYKASEGDWLEFAGYFLGLLGFSTAVSNTDATA
ncbi:hypothetical protein [Pimelobacter simplex]|uniref:hypothetical protein n=1 Tax=Nocardioides simplex TaxID=2045 RepID=UPI00214FED8A|nr:hypothetical protein [Pimelobacter simplex]UUW88411.1 hypothetical protein M0M43_22070 [Pimelobacter simplex]UUW97915.1 hypothetical protein M0M48_10715 [Pimelobacter simplex]